MHRFVVWMQEVAVPFLGAPGVFLAAFLDSSFLSLPEINDLLVVTSAASSPERGWLYVLMATLGSVAGCSALYWIGWRGEEAFLERRFGAHRVARAREAFHRWDFLALAVPALLPPPMPFKIFVLAAGVFGFSFRRFVLTLALARGLRYAVWACVGMYYGQRATDIFKDVDEWFGARLPFLLAAAILLALAWLCYHRYKRMKITRVGALSLALLAVSTALGGLLGDRVLAGGSRLQDQLRLYTAMLGAIQESYVDEVPAERLVSSSIREMLRGLDPHSNFIEPREFGQLQERQRGSYYGLGITVQAIDGNITVVSPFEGTPAHRLGIRAGDVISRIGDEDARGMSIDDAVKRLRGPKGTSVDITIVRQGYEAPLAFTVIRDEIPIHSVPYYFMATRETGYIRLTDFNETTACRLPTEGKDCERELERALRKLREAGATSYLLDIRDNPGGLLDQAFAVSNLFLKKGQLVVFTRGRSKRDESNYITERESPYAGVPLVVLTSRHSASASEIVAGAIQDHDRGLTVGETTFGKGLVQTIMPLRNVRGYALALTTGRYYTPSGRSIQRDYGQVALEDYLAPRDRKPCELGESDPKLTDAGRKVFGGDGVTPDFCVEAPQPSKLLSRLIARQAFVGFSAGYAAAEGTGVAKISGAGSRTVASSAKVRVIDRDFRADANVMAEFTRYLDERKLKWREAELLANREELAHEIEEEVLRQAFGEGEARRRSLAWDPQIQKALELVPRAATLLRDPQRYIAEREAESRVAAAGASR